MLPELCDHKQYINFTHEYLQNVPIPKVHDNVLHKLKLLDLTQRGKSSMSPFEKGRFREIFVGTGLLSVLLVFIYVQIFVRSSVKFEIIYILYNLCKNYKLFVNF